MCRTVSDCVLRCDASVTEGLRCAEVSVCAPASNPDDEAKIHAFIEMLGADACLLTEGEEIKSHELFAKLTSKKTITGEDEEEESELEYLTEIREVRDKNPDLFARIKRLPKKARSTRRLSSEPDSVAEEFPSLLTYFRQGKLDKFFLAQPTSAEAVELDFLTATKVLEPADKEEERQTIPPDFYALLDKNKKAFESATSPEIDDAIPKPKGGANDACLITNDLFPDQCIELSGLCLHAHGSYVVAA